MRIIFLSDDWPPRHKGGAGMVAFRLAKALKDKGDEILVVTTVQKKEEEGREEFEGLLVEKIYSNYHERWRAWLSLYNLQTVGKVKKIIEDFKPEVVHAHNVHYYLSYYCLKLARKSGAKVFLTAHDAMSFTYGKLRTKKYLRTAAEGKPDCKISWLDNLKMARKRFNPFRNFLIKRYLRYADRIIVVSEALKKALEQNGIKGAVVVRNGIDIDKWRFSEEAGRKFKILWELEGKKIVLFGGRLSEGKGLKKMMAAMAEVVKEIPESVLLVLGKEGQIFNYMRDQERPGNGKERVIFTRWISGGELRAAYSSSDVVCIPSLYLDPFPTINLEAMAMSRPVIGTCFGGTKEVVTHNKTGYIVNPHNINELSLRIKDLLNDSEKAHRFGERGREEVKEKFSIERWTDIMLEYYKN